MDSSVEPPSHDLSQIRRAGVDLSGLMSVLSKHLYSTPMVALRELVQNAHDSILRRRLEDADWAALGQPGRIDLSVDRAGTVLRGFFQDDAENLERGALSVTDDAKAVAARADDARAEQGVARGGDPGMDLSAFLLGHGGRWEGGEDGLGVRQRREGARGAFGRREGTGGGGVQIFADDAGCDIGGGGRA